MADKSPVKVNKEHGGKEFSSSFQFIGKIKPAREQEKETKNWVDVPYYRIEKDDNGQDKKVLEFVIETALSNDLKVKMTGKEKPYAYPYSSKHRKSEKVKWEDRFNKEKYPDDTYHLIDPEWDRIDKLKEIVVTDDAWVEVKGKYSPYEFTGENGVIKGAARTATYVNPIVDGKVKIGEDLKPIKVKNKEVAYVCDFNSSDFVEVNNFKMQIGVLSTYADEIKNLTTVNGIFLGYGKERSQPKDIELLVYNQETTEGKTPLAEAFASLDYLDFIEVTGQDNNRATFGYIPVKEKIDESDAFANVDDENKQGTYQRVTNGSKKGLEVTGYISGSLIRGYLTEEEVSKQSSNDPFDDGKPIDISDDELPF